MVKSDLRMERARYDFFGNPLEFSRDRIHVLCILTANKLLHLCLLVLSSLFLPLNPFNWIHIIPNVIFSLFYISINVTCTMFASASSWSKFEMQRGSRASSEPQHSRRAEGDRKLFTEALWPSSLPSSPHTHSSCTQLTWLTSSASFQTNLRAVADVPLITT